MSANQLADAVAAAGPGSAVRYFRAGRFADGARKSLAYECHFRGAGNASLGEARDLALRLDAAGDGFLVQRFTAAGTDYLLIKRRGS